MSGSSPAFFSMGKLEGRGEEASGQGGVNHIPIVFATVAQSILPLGNARGCKVEKSCPLPL